MQNKKSSLLLLFLILFIFSCSGKPAVKPEETFDPEKAFAKANERLEKKYYEEARASFLEIKNRDMSKKFAPLAQLKIADSYVKEGEPEAAIAEYRRFLEAYPDHRYAPYAQYQIASIYFDQIEGPERGYSGAARALEEFEKLKRMFPRNPYKDIIEVKIEKCKKTIADYEFLVGEFYYKKGSFSAAIGRFEGLLKNYPDYSREADVLFYTGMSYKNLGQKDKALEYLNRLIEKYPNNKLTTDAKKELAKVLSCIPEPQRQKGCCYRRW
ncbi:MAG: outer membrane protein assembly factor BamD [Thermodesulfovibrionales bacterium]|nr:outer membrane protein assembly factor BamD [Thermodesulfovibrionales bacterium]